MRGTRPGFTLLELIIVITIIAILAALTTGVVMRYYAVQQQTNTEVNITKIYERLKDQWDTVIRQAKEEPISPEAMAMANYAFTGTNNDVQARVIHIKLRLKQEFPMDFTEIVNPYRPPYPYPDLQPLPVYQAALAAMLSAGSIPWYQPSSTYQASPIENATCLYLALQRSRGGEGFSFDDLGSNAIASDSTGLQKWIVDAWRTPIIYFRWPTSNGELDQLNPAAPGTTQATFRDPQDPTGALFNRNWWIANHIWTPGPPNTIWTPFETQIHPLFNQISPSDPTWPKVGPFLGNSGPFPSSIIPPPPSYYVWAYEYYMQPVVASAGPNKNFGIVFPNLSSYSGSYFSLPNPMLSDGLGDDNDNIYSYRLRLGARGD